MHMVLAIAGAVAAILGLIADLPELIGAGVALTVISIFLAFRRGRNAGGR